MYTPYLLGNVVLVPFQATMPPPHERRVSVEAWTHAVPNPVGSQYSHEITARAYRRESRSVLRFRCGKNMHFQAFQRIPLKVLAHFVSILHFPRTDPHFNQNLPYGAVYTAIGFTYCILIAVKSTPVKPSIRPTDTHGQRWASTCFGEDVPEINVVRSKICVSKRSRRRDWVAGGSRSSQARFNCWSNS